MANGYGTFKIVNTGASLNDQSETLDVTCRFTDVNDVVYTHVYTIPWQVILNGPKGNKGDAGNLHIVNHGTADTTYTVPVNEMHVWGEVTELNISLGANPDQTTVAEYAFKFTSGTTATTLTLPSNVTLPAGFVILPKHQYVMTVVFGMLEYWGAAL